jgi:DNA-binding MarR family transcriptional regulator
MDHLEPQQLHALRALQRSRGPLSSRGLALATRIDRATLQSLLPRLERAGLVVGTGAPGSKGRRWTAC